MHCKRHGHVPERHGDGFAEGKPPSLGFGDVTANLAVYRLFDGLALCQVGRGAYGPGHVAEAEGVLCAGK